MIQVAYTNSNCSDLWNPFQELIKKYTKIPLYVIADDTPKNLALSGLYIYDNSEPYYKVWVNALNSFQSDYFIYLQEDFFIYSNINEDKINEYLKFLKNNEEYSFVRLIKSGNLGTNKITDTLYEIESSNTNIFSMQATIWRTSDYIKLMETVQDNKWLETERYREVMINLNMKGVCHYDGEDKRGGAHYDSNVYPYIATALVKGKWNLSEYTKELAPILNTYNIDFKKRGIY